MPLMAACDIKTLALGSVGHSGTSPVLPGRSCHSEEEAQCCKLGSSM